MLRWLPAAHNRFVAGSGNDERSESNKRRLQEPCVCVTTFNMIAHKGKRSAYGEEVRPQAHKHMLQTRQPCTACRSLLLLALCIGRGYIARQHGS